MNWMFFRSSSALRRDPTRRKWKLLTSKTNWKKQKVRSTSPSRISRMASILYLLGPCLLRNLSAKHKLEHLRLPRMFLVDRLNSCPSSHFKHAEGFPGLSYIILRLAGIPGASVSVHCAVLHSELPAPACLRESQLCLWQRVASSKSLAAFSIWKRRVWALTWCLRPTSVPLLWSGEGHTSRARQTRFLCEWPAGSCRGANPEITESSPQLQSETMERTWSWRPSRPGFKSRRCHFELSSLGRDLSLLTCKMGQMLSDYFSHGCCEDQVQSIG